MYNSKPLTVDSLVQLIQCGEFRGQFNGVNFSGNERDFHAVIYLGSLRRDNVVTEQANATLGYENHNRLLLFNNISRTSFESTSIPAFASNLAMCLKTLS